MSEINWDEVDPSDCVYDGEVWPEHDFQVGLTECQRCGAEVDDDEGDE
jgi:hypothetical protein